MAPADKPDSVESARHNFYYRSVFQLNQGGSWELKEVNGLKSAQQAITKQGFHYKSTKAVVVLKDLEAVPYTLFAESDDGLIAVSPSEANAHKKLHVCWNKTK